MKLTLEITGLNLEKLLSCAARERVCVRDVQRVDTRSIRVRVGFFERKALRTLCERYGWEMREVRADAGWRAVRRMRKQPSRLVAVALFLGLMMYSSQMLWDIRIEHAGKAVAEIRTYLKEQNIVPGRLKRSISAEALREQLMLRLPDLSFVGVRWAGSVLMIDCQEAEMGEHVLTEGESLDLVAEQAGIVTRLWVLSGTPQVEIGQAVSEGQVLIRGEERAGQDSVYPIQAQGEVIATVWARGDARASLFTQRTVETGNVRTRVTVKSPWHERVLSEAEDFESQDSSLEIQPVVGLYLPVWREVETLAETVVIRDPRDAGDAASLAQGAAEQMAKLKCPSGVEILDKWVDYSMIDDEFVYATVVLEFERNIAVRAQGVH